MSAKSPKSCWVVSDGRAGMENQALGLAEAVARQMPLSISVKRISISPFFAKLPGLFWGDPFSKLNGVSTKGGTPTTLVQPFPDLWIACGRTTIPFSQSIKKAGHSFVVQTQDPRTAPSAFDLVIPPYHDGLSGENILPLHGSPNRLTPQCLAEEAAALKALLPETTSPKIAVLIGGNSKAYRLTDTKLAEIIGQLRKLRDANFDLLITTSRRTGEQHTATLKRAISGKNVFFWDGLSLAGIGNPYFGMLGLADHILVTEESTNMVTEAASTGKPVHLLSLEGGNQKFATFHKMLAQQGITRPLTLPLESWTYSALRETDRAASALIERWQGPQKTEN